jgi:hypothetical protein
MGGTTRGGGAGSDEFFRMKGSVGRLEMLMKVREGKMVAPIYTEPFLGEKGRESGTYPQAFKPPINLLVSCADIAPSRGRGGTMEVKCHIHLSMMEKDTCGIFSG